MKKQNCVIQTKSFNVYIKANYIYKDNAEAVETRFDSSNYELNGPLHKGTNIKVIGLMKG